MIYGGGSGSFLKQSAGAFPEPDGRIHFKKHGILTGFTGFAGC
jgi:hypothetical protein